MMNFVALLAAKNANWTIFKIDSVYRIILIRKPDFRSANDSYRYNPGHNTGYNANYAQYPSSARPPNWESPFRFRVCLDYNRSECRRTNCQYSHICGHRSSNSHLAPKLLQSWCNAQQWKQRTSWKSEYRTLKLSRATAMGCFRFLFF